MKKKALGSRWSVSDPRPQNTMLNRRDSAGQDLFLYAKSFHQAAKALAASFQPNPLVDFDLCPVVFLYRHAVELHLKAIVLGEGGIFLATKPDRISIGKTHSVSWLAQFVGQIVTALKWEKEFKCDGIENLADFKAIIEELNVVDPGSYVFRLQISVQGQDSVPGSAKATIRDFARRIDALLELLDSTADALAAEWEMRSEGAIEGHLVGGDFEPTIQ